jgi:predicted SAM-dependent methyltransferase
MKLILCAGDRHVPGFTTHDIHGNQDILCDLFDIGNHVEPESCEEIHFTHALEHFPTKMVPQVLDLIYGLLKPEGRLYIEVPNFAWHAQLINEGKDREAVYYAFGGQLDEWDFHKTAFTPKIIREELEDAGFRDIDVQPASSLNVWARK